MNGRDPETSKGCEEEAETVVALAPDCERRGKKPFHFGTKIGSDAVNKLKLNYRRRNIWRVSADRFRHYY